MNKILHIAQREFVATAMTRGFLIGLLLMPAVFALLFLVGGRLMNRPARPVEGMVAIVDPTGAIAGRLRDVLRPDAVAARRVAGTEANLPGAVRDAGLADLTTQQVRDRARADAPRIAVIDLADVAAARQWLTGGVPADRRLAVIVVKPD